MIFLGYPLIIIKWNRVFFQKNCAIWPKNFRRDVIVKFFWRCLELWQFKSRVTTWNPEIGNIPIWVLLNIWKLERVKDTKFGMNVSNEMLLNVRVTAFKVFELLKESQCGGGLKLPPSRSIELRTFLINVNKPAKNCRLGYIWSDLKISLMKTFSFLVQ